MSEGGARVVWFSTLAVGVGLATWAFGWMAVPVLAGAWAWIRRGDPAVPLMAALAAPLAWGVLLALPGVTGGGTARVAEVVGAAMQVGPFALVVLTLAFPALLAGSVAGVVRGVSAPARPRPPRGA
ncbi:MAG: hypothetical protein WD771_07880 [Gemmatimonadaceae bacterium]